MQKVVLITGASSGLGLATALHLSEKGFNVFGTSRNPKKYKEHYECIASYSPYNNLKPIKYPPVLVTSSLFDSRVLYTEPVKYIAKLRDVKTDNNVQLS